MSRRKQYSDLPLVPFVDSEDEIFFGPVTAYERRRRERVDQLNANLSNPPELISSNLSSSSSEDEDESDSEVSRNHVMYRYLKSTRNQQEDSVFSINSSEDMDETTNCNNVYSDLSSTAFDFDDCVKDYKDKSFSKCQTAQDMEERESDSTNSFTSAEERLSVKITYEENYSGSNFKLVNNKTNEPLNNTTPEHVSCHKNSFGPNNASVLVTTNVRDLRKNKTTSEISENSLPQCEYYVGFASDSPHKVLSPKARKENSGFENAVKNQSSGSKVKIVQEVDYFNMEDEESINQSGFNDNSVGFCTYLDKSNSSDETFENDVHKIHIIKNLSALKVNDSKQNLSSIGSVKLVNNKTNEPLNNTTPEHVSCHKNSFGPNNASVLVTTNVRDLRKNKTTSEISENSLPQCEYYVGFVSDSPHKVLSPKARKENSGFENTVKNQSSGSKVKIVQEVDYFSMEDEESINQSGFNDNSLGFCTYLDKSNSSDETFENDVHKIHIIKNLSALKVNDSKQNLSSIGSESMNDSLNSVNNFENVIDSEVNIEESNYLDCNNSMYVNVSLAHEDAFNDLTCSIKYNCNSTLHSFDSDNNSFISNISCSPHYCKTNKTNHTDSQEVDQILQCQEVHDVLNIEQSVLNKSNIWSEVESLANQIQETNNVSNIEEAVSNKSIMHSQSSILPDVECLYNQVQECQGINSVSNIEETLSDRSIRIRQSNILPADGDLANQIQECQRINVSNIEEAVSNKSIMHSQSSILPDVECLYNQVQECQGINSVSNIEETLSDRSIRIRQSNILPTDGDLANQIQKCQRINVSNIEEAVSNKSIMHSQSSILPDVECLFDQIQECQGINNVSNIEETLSDRSIRIRQSNILPTDGDLANQIQECQGINNNVSNIEGTVSNKSIMHSQSSILPDVECLFDQIQECQGINNVSNIEETLSDRSIRIRQSNILPTDGDLANQIQECQGINNNVSNIEGTVSNKSIMHSQSSILPDVECLFDQIQECQGINNVSNIEETLSDRSIRIRQSNILPTDGDLANQIQECQGINNNVSNIEGTVSNKSIMHSQSSILPDVECLFDQIQECQGINNVSNIEETLSDRSIGIRQSNILPTDGDLANQIQECQGINNNVSNIEGTVSNKSIMHSQSSILPDVECLFDQIQECQGINNVSNIEETLSDRSIGIRQSNILPTDGDLANQIQECQGINNNVSNIEGTVSNKSIMHSQSSILPDVECLFDQIQECQGINNVSNIEKTLSDRSIRIRQSNILPTDGDLANQIQECQGINNISNIKETLSNNSMYNESSILPEVACLAEHIQECQGMNVSIQESMSNKSNVHNQSDTLSEESNQEFDKNMFSTALQSQASSFKSADDTFMKQKHENIFEGDNEVFFSKSSDKICNSPPCSFTSSLHLSAAETSTYSIPQENTNAGQSALQLEHTSDLFDETDKQGCFKSIEFSPKYTSAALKTVAPTNVLNNISYECDLNIIETVEEKTNLCAVKRNSDQISQESEFVSALQSQESSFKNTSAQMVTECEDQLLVSSGIKSLDDSCCNSPACKKKCSVPCNSFPKPSLLCTSVDKKSGQCNLKSVECESSLKYNSLTLEGDANNSTGVKCDSNIIHAEKINLSDVTSSSKISQESKQSGFISALESHESSFKSTCTNMGSDAEGQWLNAAGTNVNKSVDGSPLNKESCTQSSMTESFFEPMEISYTNLENCFNNYRNTTPMDSSLITDVIFCEPAGLSVLDESLATNIQQSCKSDKKIPIDSKLPANKTTENQFKTKSLLRPPKFNFKPTGILAKVKLNEDWKQTTSKPRGKEQDSELPSLKHNLLTPTLTKSKIPRLPSSSKQQCFTPRSETAVSTTSSKKQNLLYQNVKSPIRTYIQTASPVLVTQVKFTEKSCSRMKMRTGSSEKKNTNVMQKLNYNVCMNEETENVDPNYGRPSLLPVIYKSAPNVFLKDNQDVQKKLPKLNAKFKKLLDTPRPKVIKHEGRTNIPPSEPGSLLINAHHSSTMNNDLPTHLDSENDISICATKTLFKSNALSK